VPSQEGRAVTDKAGRSAYEVAVLGEKEALQRLDLLASASRIIDGTLEDYDTAAMQVADACVPEFADMCAVEVIGTNGDIRTVAYRTTHSSGLQAPEEWTPVGRVCAPDRRPLLAYDSPDELETCRAVRERLGAQSLIVAPITGGGITLGWFVGATGPFRRGFRPSALRIGVELSSRLGAAIQRVLLHREMQSAARDQSRAVRRLRRLATAATNLAGAATTEAVLRVACVEACVIQEADGAIARWWMADGTEVSAHTGEVDWDLAETAFAAVTNRRAARGRGWMAQPLPSSDPWQHAALVVFVANELSIDEELVLSSLASLVPVAFERAVGTQTVVLHEARLRAVVETSPIALIGIRTDGVVTLANRAALDLFHWVGEPTEWALTDSLRPPVMELVKSVADATTVLNQTVSLEGFELSLSGAPMPAVAAADEPPTVLVAGVDLTEIRRAERALVQAQRLEAMGVVAGRVAHDFNNLLTLIIGYTELLARELSGPDQHDHVQNDHVHNIESAARRAASLTQQMLGMTRRQDTGEVTDLAAELAGLDAVLTRLVGPTVNLVVRYPESAVRAQITPTEIEQIVINLVVNACDAMERSGHLLVQLEVAPAAGRDAPARIGRGSHDPEDRIDHPGLGALLTISDDGPGMSAEVLARCMEPFFTTKPKGVGSGLGLSTVYGLVVERGGDMGIESSPGEGTAVRIWLPPCDGEEHEATEAEPDLEQWPSGRLLRARVLFVEDNDELRQMGRNCLESIGCEVVTVAAAEQALEILALEGRFDIMVTDIMLPGMSGVEMANAARETHADLPVLYMTGYSGGPNPAGVPASGSRTIQKPYRPDVLRLRVAELLADSVAQGSNR
jgi:signal transduction histidine kinase/CheY-like chemotaxis protein